MCVIYACGTSIPSEDELRRGAVQNSHGAGIAWVQRGLDGVGPTIRWKKGLKNEKDVLAYIAENKIPLPLVIHFRTASVGGQDPLLTHPFPIEEGVKLSLEGESTNGVLFHNGHIGNWEDYTFRAGLAADEDFPDGIWSDTRGLTWMVHLKGPGIIKFVAGMSRVAMLYPDGVEKDPWTFLDMRGNWEDPEDENQGWLQSSKTEWSGTRITRGNAHWDHTRGWVDDDDDPIPDACRPSTTTPTPTVRTMGPDDSQEVTTGWNAANATNIWTVEELNGVLADLEKELADARSAAGL